MITFEKLLKSEKIEKIFKTNIFYAISEMLDCNIEILKSHCKKCNVEISENRGQLIQNLLAFYN